MSVWEIFAERCLLPVEDCRNPVVQDLTRDDSFVDPEELRDQDKVYVFHERDMAIVCGRYERDGNWYNHVRLELAHGAENFDLLEDLRSWARISVKEGRYERPSSSAKGSLALRSTGWRSPTLEIYSDPPSDTYGRFIQLWETYT